MRQCRRSGSRVATPSGYASAPRFAVATACAERLSRATPTLPAAHTPPEGSGSPNCGSSVPLPFLVRKEPTMSELTLALIMAAISIGISAVGAALIIWLHLRDDERAFLPPSRLRRRRITASV